MITDKLPQPEKPLISEDEHRAIVFAAERHGRQAYGRLPYITHLAEVRGVLAQYHMNFPELRVAAWLHDTIEDTETAREEIAVLFGEKVAALVWAVSGLPKGAPRKQRTADAYAKIADFGSPFAGYLKLADRIANVRSSLALAQGGNVGLYRMYQGERLGFEAMLKHAGVDHMGMLSELRDLSMRPLPGDYWTAP